MELVYPAGVQVDGLVLPGRIDGRPIQSATWQWTLCYIHVWAQWRKQWR